MQNRFEFLELDESTRVLMLDELELDLEAHGEPYRGKNLTERGHADYPELLRQAITDHEEVWLTDQLNREGRCNASPVDAARRLAQNEFNRYYIRGICRRAAEHGTNIVISYRARKSQNPRPESIRLENQPHPAPRILANLRGRAQEGDPESTLGAVGSGMSARCGCPECAPGSS